MAVPTSTLTTNYEDLEVGERIREQRKKLGWTLQELADRLSISSAALSGIENNKKAVNIERLAAISEALGVDPRDLLSLSTARHVHVQFRRELEGRPPAEVRILAADGGPHKTHHNLATPLADPFAGKDMDPFLVEVHPIPDSEIRLACHDKEEFFLVLRGEVEWLLQTPDGLVRRTLGPGECAHFWSYLPHCVRSAGTEPALSVHVNHLTPGGSDSLYSAAGPGLVYLREAREASAVQQVGARITALRRGHGLSTAEFAHNLGVGTRQMVALERGRKPAPLDLLLRVGQQTKRPIEYFLDGVFPGRPYLAVAGAAEHGQSPVRRYRPDGTVAAEYTPLVGLPHRTMHAFRIKNWDVGDERPLIMREHHGQEFAYVLSGEVVMWTVDGEEAVSQTLQAGDSYYIDATVRHRIVVAGRNPYERPCADVLAVFWCPLGEAYLLQSMGFRPEHDRQ